MQIHTGKLYKNKTLKYLYPSLKFYGEDLTDNLRNLVKLAVGIGDTNDYTEEQNIYILLDTKPIMNKDYNVVSYSIKLQTFLEWFRLQKYYVKDYIVRVKNEGDKHMIVIRVPNTLCTAFNNFIKGKYSKMYSNTQIEFYFGDRVIQDKDVEEIINKELRGIRGVLTKDKTSMREHIVRVNKDFNTNIKLEEVFEVFECDYPLRLSEEIFNYEKKEGDLWN